MGRAGVHRRRHDRLVAVEAAGRGDWLRALLALGGLAVLAGVMFVGWSALLVRRTTASRTGRKPRRLLTATGPRDAAAAKELRSWTRDLLYGHRAVFAISYGLFFCLMPLAVGWKGMLPWAGPAALVMAGSMSSNLYGSDGTALWTTLTDDMGPARGRVGDGGADGTGCVN